MRVIKCIASMFLLAVFCMGMFVSADDTLSMEQELVGMETKAGSVTAEEAASLLNFYRLTAMMEQAVTDSFSLDTSEIFPDGNIEITWSSDKEEVLFVDEANQRAVVMRGAEDEAVKLTAQINDTVGNTHASKTFDLLVWSEDSVSYFQEPFEVGEENAGKKITDIQALKGWTMTSASASECTTTVEIDPEDPQNLIALNDRPQKTNVDNWAMYNLSDPVPEIAVAQARLRFDYGTARSRFNIDFLANVKDENGTVSAPSDAIALDLMFEYATAQPMVWTTYYSEPGNASTVKVQQPLTATADVPAKEEWFNLKVVFNFKAKYCDIYINGEKVNLEAVPLRCTTDPNNYKKEIVSIRQIRFHCNRAYADAKMYVDDLSLRSVLSDEEACQNALNAIELPQMAEEDLFLPTQGDKRVNITWESDHPDIIAADGTVTRPYALEDSTVKLTATTMRGNASIQKEFEVCVPAIAPFKIAEVEYQNSDGMVQEELIGGGIIGSVKVQKNTPSSGSFVLCLEEVNEDKATVVREAEITGETVSLNYQLPQDTENIYYKLYVYENTSDKTKASEEMLLYTSDKVLKQLNSVQNSKDMTEILLQHAETIKIDTTREDYIPADFVPTQEEPYSEVQLKVSEMLMGYRQEFGDFKNLSTLADMWAEWIAVAHVNLASRTEMDEVLHTYQEVLNIDLSGDYLKADPVTIAQNLSGYDFLNAVQVKEAFDAAVKKYFEEESGGSGMRPSGGSSGGGSSGGGAGNGAVSFTGSGNQISTIPDEKEKNDPFTDIEQVSWAKEAILSLYEDGIINGVSETEFAPERGMKKEEYVKMLVLAFDLLDENATCTFNDVEEGQWYVPYAASAVNSGMIEGMGDGNFGIGKMISRQEAAVILYRVMQKQGVEPESLENVTPFTDMETDVATWARQAVREMQSWNLINGMDDGRFAPLENVTRAQAAKILYGALTVK